MKKYIEFKIMKKNLVIFAAIVFTFCSVVGYYFWCSYHPHISIITSDGPTGKEGIKMEAPHISITPTGIAEPSASIELKCNNIIMQHEFFCTYIKDTYETADIKLDIEVKDNKTILIYFGTAITEDGKSIILKKNLIVDLYWMQI